MSYEERHLGNDASASKVRILASKKQMLAYLLAGILRMLGKMHDSFPGRGSPGSWKEEIATYR